MANPQVVVDFVSNTKGLNQGFNSASGQASGFGTKLKGLAKTGALAAGAAGLGAVVATLKIGIDEYAAAAKVAAQTNAVIKSTGGVANVSAKHVAGMAEALMKKSGVDDEAIASGENLLLTFTNIRNGVGKGNQVFDQATKASLDMSVALGTDLQSAALQVGKALNDPVKGMAKLQRSGVEFTQAQKDQVAALVAAGKPMQAQKVILKELNKEFGGSAAAAGKTLPGQLNILKESFNNLAGELVAKLIPYVKLTISWLRDHWPEIQAVMAAAWANIKPLLIALGQLFALTAKFIADHWATIGPVILAAVSFFTLGMRIVAGVVKIVVALLKGDWAGAWRAAKDTVKVATDTIRSVVAGAFGAVRLIVEAAWSVVRGATRGAWEAVKDTVRSGVGVVKDVLRGLVDWVSSFAGGIFASAMARVGRGFDKIVDGARDALGAVKDVLNNMVDFVVGIIGRVGSAAGRIASALKAPINAVIGAINSVKIGGQSVTIKVPKLPDIHFTTPSIDPFPNIPKLAKGGIVTGPTVALLGEAGPEMVAPLSGAGAGAGVQVRVFIGDTELRGLVRTEVVDANTGIARSLLAGGCALTLAATVEAGYQNVRLDYTTPAGTVRATFARVGPSGTRAVVRGWNRNPVSAGVAIVARDYEAPIGVPLTYTVQAFNSDSVVIDTATATLTIASGGCDDTWLNDLARVGNTLRVVVERIPELAYLVPSSVHEVISRRSPIVTSDVAHTASLELSVLTETDDARERARALLGNGVPILLRTPPELGVGNMYLSVLGFAEQRIVSDGTVKERRFVVQARHVSRPDPTLYAPLAAILYDDVRDTYSDYLELRAGASSYDALLYAWVGEEPSDIVPWPADDV